MSESCPRDSMTLKETAVGLVTEPLPHYRSNMLVDMTIGKLKHETDARSAVYLAAFKPCALSDQMQDTFVDWITDKNGKPEKVQAMTHIELADHFVQKTPQFFNAIIPQYTKLFISTPWGREFYDQFDMFRAAYFARSPAAAGKEKQYGSVQSLLASGFVTGTMHIQGIMARQNVAAIHAGLGVDETQALIVSSPHLALLISKLSLAQEERYADASNEGGFDNNPVRIVKGTYSFSPDLFARMRALKRPDDPLIAHRPHLQCPASISFPNEDSFNSEFLTWYNGALARAGFWDKQK